MIIPQSYIDVRKVLRHTEAGFQALRGLSRQPIPQACSTVRPLPQSWLHECPWEAPKRRQGVPITAASGRFWGNEASAEDDVTGGLTCASPPRKLFSTSGNVASSISLTWTMLNLMLQRQATSTRASIRPCWTVRGCRGGSSAWAALTIDCSGSPCLARAGAH